MPEVSIVMAAMGRPDATRRSLESYCRLTYPDYEFLLIDTIQNGETLETVFKEFEKRLPIVYIPIERNKTTVYDPNKTWTPATSWNHGIKRSSGKFIITCSSDLIISAPDMIEKYLAQYTTDRISVLTYFLSLHMTNNLLDTVDWKSNPDIIQTFGGFWGDVIHADTNFSRRLAGLTTYVTGQPKDMWEYMGLFRTELSHLVSDQDMMLRDVCLGRGVGTLHGCVAYHQEHPIDLVISGANLQPGWNYHNEAQARLLEPAPRDPN
jgi:glycosyltransferase involved in cell wall biosynthesis